MTHKNFLFSSPPYAVETALKQLGADLKIARTRRNMTIANVAERIGTGPRAVMDAEKGKPTSSVAIFVALMWVYDLLKPLSDATDPTKDTRGVVLGMAQERRRARKPKGMNNDF